MKDLFLSAQLAFQLLASERAGILAVWHDRYYTCMTIKMSSALRTSRMLLQSTAQKPANANAYANANANAGHTVQPNDTAKGKLLLGV